MPAIIPETKTDTVPQIVPQTKEWAEEIKAEFRAAKDIRSLLEIGKVFYYARYSPEVQQLCLPAFYKRAQELAPEAKGKRVVAADLSGIYFAAFSVCEGKEEVVEHTLKMLRNLYRETQPDHFIVAIDSRKSYRKSLFDGYKASRPSKPRNFSEHLKSVIVELKTKEVQVEEHDLWESDDVMASIAFRGKLLQQKVVLVSEDKDLWQTLGGNVQQFCFRSDHREYRDAAWLAREHQIAPRQVVDWLCLAGKDDVPSAAKIGPKTASEWLHEHGTFLTVWENRESLSEKKREAIEEFYETYWLAKKLHTLNVTLDVFWG